MIDRWIQEIKEQADPHELGMFLAHHGIVRATSKDGKPVRGMRLTYNRIGLRNLIEELSARDGIVAIRVWINEGALGVGDDIMYALVAGKFRTHVFPVLQELVSRIKQEIVSEEEEF